ncbi:MAG TPA: lamin tail domain-containing protein [Kofleriaceae bacterium]|nr:lamin tail domain-containing protein [Kofleriaceae bacterium]
MLRWIALLGALTGAVAACGPTTPSSSCKQAFVVGDLVITEVFADYQAPAGSSADTGNEWFEIYNNTEDPAELQGLTITHSRPDGSNPLSHVMREVTIAPGQYYVLGNAQHHEEPAYVDYGYGSELGELFNSDGGKLSLACGDTEIDAAQYTNVKPGHSRELTSALAPDYTTNDDLTNWCQGNETEFVPGNFGTPASENDCQPVVIGACSDGGVTRDTVPPGIGDLVITEVMPKPKLVSATLGQWFEVQAQKDVDLNGVGLDRANDLNVPPQLIDAPACVHLTAGSYAVFARNTDLAQNGGVIAIAGFSFSLNPTANPDVQLVYGSTIIDSIEWDTSTSGASLALDPMFTDAASNDDPLNFCSGSAPYNSMDLGTPGAANTTCPIVVGPGQCLDHGTPRAIVKPAAGQLVISELMPNAAGTGTDPTQEWFELANIGSAAFDLNGLGVKGGSATVNVINSPDCKPVAAGGFALFAHNTDPATNGGLPAVDATFTFALSTALSVLDGATLLDAVTLVNPQPADGVSRQVNPAQLTTTGNDAAASFCDSPKDAGHMYGPLANYGTPKAANTCM